MKRMLPVAMMALLLSCNKHDDNPNAVNAVDKQFMIQTYLDNRTEIQSSQMALNLSTNSDVRYFANALFRQSSFAQSDLIAVAKQINFSLTDTASENYQSASTTNGTTGYSDTGYIRNSARILQSSLRSFQNELNEGNNTYLRHYYLNKYVNGIKDYYLLADSLSRKL